MSSILHSGVCGRQMTRRRFSAGYGPVVDLASDPTNAALVSKVRLPSPPRPIHVDFGILTVERPILAVLGEWDVGRWSLPWTRVGGFEIRLLEGADHRATLAPSSLRKTRMENLSLRERRSLHFPTRRRKSTAFRSRWYLTPANVKTY